MFWWILTTYICGIFKLILKINSQQYGTWFIAKGSMTQRELLAEDNYPISHVILSQAEVVEIEIVPQSVWYDVQFTLYLIKQ